MNIQEGCINNSDWKYRLKATHIFYSGYMVVRFSGADITSKFIGIGLLFGTLGVPKAMQKFG